MPAINRIFEIFFKITFMTHETKWSVDLAHSEIEFKVRHLMIAGVRGSFKKFDASIYTTGKDFSTAEVDFWIDTASVSTGSDIRDEHLRSADFLDTERYPQITFLSNTIKKSGIDNNHELWGDLTIKGISKNVQLNLQFGGIQNDPFGNQKAGFTVTGKIKRSDWDITWNKTIDTGGLLVGEEIFISCEVELIKAQQEALTMVLEPSVNDKTSL
jgi:polyisoprenoid-binding protein YceI